MATTGSVYRKTSHGRASNTTGSKAGSTYSRTSKATSSTSSVVETGDDRHKPTIWSILATRRMARALTSRLRNRARPSAMRIPLEPTYRMEPERKFNTCQVEKVIRDVLEAHLHDFTYQAKRCPLLSRVLTEEIKDRVKALEFDRYKIVCVVTLGEKIGQDMRVSSRCVWDDRVDAFSSYNWENSTAFCTATVYGIYHE